MNWRGILNTLGLWFAALVLVSLTGIAIFAVFNVVARLVLGKWHESEVKQDR